MAQTKPLSRRAIQRRKAKSRKEAFLAAEAKRLAENREDKAFSLYDGISHEPNFSGYFAKRNSYIINDPAHNSTSVNRGNFIKPIKGDVQCWNPTSQCMDVYYTDLFKSTREDIRPSYNFQMNPDPVQINLPVDLNYEVSNKYQECNSLSQIGKSLIDSTNIVQSNRSLNDEIVSVMSAITVEQQNELQTSGDGTISDESLVMASEQSLDKPVSNYLSCSISGDSISTSRNIHSDTNTAVRMQRHNSQAFHNPSVEMAMLEQITAFIENTKKCSDQSVKTKNVFSNRNKDAMNLDFVTVSNKDKRFAIKDIDTEISRSSILQHPQYGGVDNLICVTNLQGAKDDACNTLSNSISSTLEHSEDEAFQCKSSNDRQPTQSLFFPDGEITKSHSSNYPSTQKNIIETSIYNWLQDSTDTTDCNSLNNSDSTCTHHSDVGISFTDDVVTRSQKKNVGISFTDDVVTRPQKKNVCISFTDDVVTRPQKNVGISLTDDVVICPQKKDVSISFIDDVTHHQHNPSVNATNAYIQHCKELDIFERMFNCKNSEQLSLISEKDNELYTRIHQSTENGIPETSLTYPHISWLPPNIPQRARCLADSMSETNKETDTNPVSHSAKSSNEHLCRSELYINYETIRKYVVGEILKEQFLNQVHNIEVHRSEPGSFTNQISLRDCNFNILETPKSKYSTITSASAMNGETPVTTEEEASKIAGVSKYTLSKLCKIFVDLKYQKLYHYLPCNLLNVSFETSDWEMRILFEIGLKVLNLFTVEFETNKSIYAQNFVEKSSHIPLNKQLNNDTTHSEFSTPHFSTQNSNQYPVAASSSITHQQCLIFNDTRKHLEPIAQKQIWADVSNSLNLSEVSKNEALHRECARLKLNREGSRLEEFSNLLCLKEQDVSVLNGPNTPYSHLLAAILDTKQVNTECPTKFEQSQFASAEEASYEYLCVAIAEFYTSCYLYLNLPDVYKSQNAEPESDPNFVLNNWLIGARTLIGRNLEILAVNIDKVGRSFSNLCSLSVIVSLQNIVLSTVYLIQDPLLPLSNKMTQLETLLSESSCTLTQLLETIKK